MSQMICPFCGRRELREFEFRKTVPLEGQSSLARVYLRQNALHISSEHWQHVQGCRAWLLVRRNPSTGVVLSTILLPEQTS